MYYSLHEWCLIMKHAYFLWCIEQHQIIHCSRSLLSTMWVHCTFYFFTQQFAHCSFIQKPCTFRGVDWLSLSSNDTAWVAEGQLSNLPSWTIQLQKIAFIIIFWKIQFDWQCCSNISQNVVLHVVIYIWTIC